ncbi:3880_t:CDS:10 [Gigaspora margarita]|uniref:3880_t:CDS:1 n=1 Tax=Gigaspora margarita TaxID=4874 RepID=A0ABM8W0H4_GIGMA|nr:3880_t:CDS:10 [Gigaspora margarita]
MVEKEIINISIKLVWNVSDSSATFIGPLEFTTVLNHDHTTIKNLDMPDTVLLNGKSYKRMVDEPVHNNIHDLLSSINSVSLEEGPCPEAIVQANYIEHTEKNQHTDIEIADNQYPIILIPSVNFDMQESSEIDDSEDDITDVNESSKVNKQPLEIQAEADALYSDHRYELEQPDDSLSPEKNDKPSRVSKLAPLNISRKKKERVQIQYTSSSDSKADSNEDKSTSSDMNNITEVQISTTINEIDKNKALLLKNNFEVAQKNQLIVYGNKLFVKNRSIEDLLITDFSVQFSQLKYTKVEVEEKMLKLLYELSGAYLASLVILAEENENDKKKSSTHKTLHGLVKKKVKSTLRISERYEQRYWVGTWRLIELLNITHCPASILVESGLTARYLMRDAKYDQFLQSLLNNVEAYYEAPKFNESLILRLRYNQGAANIDISSSITDYLGKVNYAKWNVIDCLKFLDKKNCTGLVSENKVDVLEEIKKQLHLISINQSLNKKAQNRAKKLYKNVEKQFQFKETSANRNIFDVKTNLYGSEVAVQMINDNASKRFYLTKESLDNDENLIIGNFNVREFLMNWKLRNNPPCDDLAYYDILDLTPGSNSDFVKNYLPIEVFDLKKSVIDHYLPTCNNEEKEFLWSYLNFQSFERDNDLLNEALFERMYREMFLTPLITNIFQKKFKDMKIYFHSNGRKIDIVWATKPLKIEFAIAEISGPPNEYQNFHYFSDKIKIVKVMLNRIVRIYGGVKTNLNLLKLYGLQVYTIFGEKFKGIKKTFYPVSGKVLSTSGAAQLVAEEPYSKNSASASGKLCIRLYGLENLLRVGKRIKYNKSRLTSMNYYPSQNLT